jgi:uncharacterized membrane protein YgcG
MPNKLCLYFFQLWLMIYGLGVYSSVWAQNIPPKPEPAKFVNDYANALYRANTGDKENLENKLKKYADSTSTQVVIVIINYLEGVSVEDYAQKLAETWGIGQKSNNNGILILIAYYDKKVRIHTGYGIEAIITDLTARQIIDNQLVPNFKAENYYQGLEEATEVIFKLLSGEFKASDIPRRKMTFEEGSDFAFYVFMTTLFVGLFGWIVMSVVLMSVIKAEKGWLSSTGIGNAAISELPMLLTHLFLTYIYNAWIYWQWIAGIYVGTTLFIWLITNSGSSKGSKTYSSGNSWSSSSSYSDSSSSYSGSSSSYSDSYSDSSYGGGSFGGGGASGSW